MGLLLDGRAIADERRASLKKRIHTLPSKPGLAVLLIGDDPASQIYVDLKEKAAREVGIAFEKVILDARTQEEAVIDRITALNAHPDIHGIVIQLPLPLHLNGDRAVAAMDPAKDADGFHPRNVARFLAGETGRTPTLIRAITTLLKASGIALNRKRAAVIARESVFTRCLRFVLERQGASVVIHPPLNAVAAATEQADLLIVAAGKPKIIKEYMVKPGVAVIDIGINRTPEGKIVGDVDTEPVKRKASWITPVPGGVGPVTVISLLENVVEAYEQVQSVKGKG